MIWATSASAVTSTATGTTMQSLHGNGTGAPTWGSSPGIVWMTQDRTISSTTASTTTDLVMPIGANASFAFDCLLTLVNSVSTSTMRFAVDAPASPTRAVSFQYTSFSTSATTILGDTVAVQWATTCTGCTRSVTASVLTTAMTMRLTGNLVNGVNSGNVTIFFAGSAAILHTLKKGSLCTYWTT